MPHESVEGPTFTEPQTVTQKWAWPCVLSSVGSKLWENKLILYLQYTAMSFKFIRK